MTNPLDKPNDEMQELSKRVLVLLHSMDPERRTDDDTELRDALDKCTILDFNPHHIGFSIKSDGRVSITNYIGNIDQLAETLKTNKTITALNLGLYQNFTSPKYFEALCNALEHNKTIRYLSLTSCNLSSKQGLRLAKALEKNDTLTHLDISCNQLGPLAAACLIRDTKLTYLNLDLDSSIMDSNQPDPLYPILDALKDNTNLKTLSLQDMPISLNDANQLVDVLANNTTLTSLDLRFCTPKHSAKSLAKLFTTNTHLTELDLSQLQLSHSYPDDIDALAKAIRSNTDTALKIQSKGSATKINEAVLFRKNKMRQKAHRLGQALSPHLPEPVSNIVADYLGLKRNYFTAGFKNKPLLLTPPQWTKLKKHLATAVLFLAITTSLTIFGLATGSIPLIVLGLVGAIPALISTAIYARRYSQEKKAIAANRAPRKTRTPSDPTSTPASTIPSPAPDTQTTTLSSENESPNVTPPNSVPKKTR